MIDEYLFRQIASLIALIITFLAFYPYFRSILTGRTRPHIFTWIIWGGGTITVGIAQMADGAGIGGWPTLVSGTLTSLVAVLAMFRGADRSIHRIDWVFLALAISAFPLWFVLDSPLAAVIVLTIVDMLGFGPSVRKAWMAPHEENISFFALSVVRNVFAIAAMETLNLTTVLFPAAVFVACLLFVVLIAVRRRILDRPELKPA